MNMARSIHYAKLKVSAETARKQRRSRAVSGSRFKDARLLCALSVSEAGKLFRVTPRTVQNWEAGRAMVPYSAFKLMRILRGFELPNAHWKGYRLKGDTLWSPEGKAFKAEDARWWLLTALMAEHFRATQAAQRKAQQQERQASQPPQAAAGLPLAASAPHGVGSDVCTPAPAPPSRLSPDEVICIVPSANRGLKLGGTTQSGTSLAPHGATLAASDNRALSCEVMP